MFFQGSWIFFRVALTFLKRSQIFFRVARIFLKTSRILIFGARTFSKSSGILFLSSRMFLKASWIFFRVARIFLKVRKSTTNIWKRIPNLRLGLHPAIFFSCLSGKIARSVVVIILPGCQRTFVGEDGTNVYNHFLKCHKINVYTL